MNILIPGGTGLIGQRLVRSLLKRGDHVRILSRGSGSSADPQRAGVDVVRWDARTSQGWGQFISETDVVINLAGANIGERPWTQERKRVIRESRVQAGQAVVEAVRQSARKPALVVQIAGVGYYGAQQDEALDELSPAGNDFLADVAADWEGSTYPVETLGVRRVVLRAGVVLTPRGGVLEPFLLQNSLFAGGPLGSGRQWVSWIHVDDLVRAILFMMDHVDTQGIYNATAPNPLTNREFGRAVSGVLGRPFWAPVPSLALKVVMGEMSSLVLDGQRVLPRRLLQAGFTFDFPTLPEAVADLLEKRKAAAL